MPEDPDIEPREGIDGFIVSSPRLTTMSDGRSRFYARIGMEHSQHLGGGRFEQLDATFHNMVATGRIAEIAADKLVKGDRFVALGHFEKRPDRNDPDATIKEFVLTAFGPNAALTTYAVDRTPRRGVSREAAGTAAERESGLDAPAEPSAVRAPRGRPSRTTASGRQLADLSAGSAPAQAVSGDDIPF